MIAPTRIPLGHLYSTGVQPDVQYSPEQQEFINLLTNKDQYLQDQQYAEVGKLMAAVKTPELLAKLQPKALERINRHKQDLMNLYKMQRDRRRLSDENLLEADRLQRELMFDLSSLRQTTEDFLKSQDDISKYAAGGYITPDEVVQLQNEFYAKAADPNTNFGDIPFFSQMLGRAVNPKIEKAKQEDAYKKIEQVIKPLLDRYAGRDYTRPTLDQWKQVMLTSIPNDEMGAFIRLHQSTGAVPQSATPEEAFDILAKKYYPQTYAKTEAPSTYVRINNQNEKNQPWNWDVDPQTGDYIGTPTQSSDFERTVRFKDGTTSKVKVIEQRTDPDTKKTSWVIQKLIPKDPEVWGSTDTWSEAQIISEDDEPSFGRLFKQRPEFVKPKNVVDKTQPKPQEKTYKMQDALIQYQGYSEKQIRENLSKLGYREVK